MSDPIKVVRWSAFSVPGPSNYDVWLAEGNTGSFEDYLETLRGPEGPEGDTTQAEQLAQEAADAAAEAAESAASAVDTAVAANQAAAAAEQLAIQVAQSQTAGRIAYKTYAELAADLAHPEGTLGEVTNDSDPSLLGTYIKEGGSGSGSWTKSALDVSGRVSSLESNKADKDFSNVPDGSVDGRLLGIEPNRLVGAVDPQWDLARADKYGNVLWGVKQDATAEFGRVISQRGMTIGGGWEVNLIDDPVWSMAVVDGHGFVGWGVRKDGSFPGTGGGDDPGGGDPGGGGGDDGPIVWPSEPVTVHRAYIEVYVDPSKDMILHWHDDYPAGDRIQYRKSGTLEWTDSPHGWSREFPFRTETIHSVILEGLEAATEYEFRIPGDATVRKFRTVRDNLSTPLKLFWASDYQPTDMLGNTLLETFGAITVAEEPDILLLGGDYVNDNGEQDETLSGYWCDFLDRLIAGYMPDGVLRPIAPIDGNHEVTIGGTPPRTVGYMDILFSWLWDDRVPSRGLKGCGYFRIANEFLYIGFSSGHSSYPSQSIGWFQSVVNNLAPAFRHVIVACHAGPFPAGRSASNYSSTTRERAIRNNHLVACQDLPNLKYWLSGHSHVLHISPKLKMDLDPELTGAENDDRFYEDPDGIRFLGTGSWCSGTRAFHATVLSRESSIDGSKIYEIGLDDTSEYGAVTNGTPGNSRQIWFIELHEDKIAAKAVNENGLPFYEGEESL